MTEPEISMMKAPANGVAVRMYRQGHGDCFLLAFPRKDGDTPVYVLIDCGYKPGSPKFVHNKGPKEIVDHIGASTDYHLDLVILTHEHQDHLNAIWKKQNPYFEEFSIEKAWLAWTEDPADDLANQLRQRHKDQLLGLIEARRKLALGVGEDDQTVRRLDSLLSLEFGGEDDTFNLDAMRAAVDDPSTSVNKQALKLIKDKAAARQGVAFLKPGGLPITVPGTNGMRAFVLGPPRNEDLLLDEDPVGDEGFPEQELAAHGLSLWATLQSDREQQVAPFERRFHASANAARSDPFFRDHYGEGKTGSNDVDKSEVPANAAWRRIDTEWLYAAENLGLQLNSGINNTSLVLAFELPISKKILLFAGDAQRGNWISWDDQSWSDGDRIVKARDLLARTVLYKVGHHGSHNATLAGEVDDSYPNLSWMGREQYAGEFTAMITAVNAWAMTQDPPWRHPLPSIKRALEKKAQGRVFQTDVDKPEKPSTVADADWDAFWARTTCSELYFEYIISDG